MKNNFVCADGLDFSVNGKKIVFRGYGIGNWLNLEHFMLGIPGVESQIRAEIVRAYGKEKAEQFWKKYYECYVAESDIAFLKELGVNAVRIPFNYHHFESDQDPYHFDKKGFEQIDRVLSYCKKYGIYAILDLHAAPGGQNPDWHCDNAVGESHFWERADYRKRVMALWQFIAARYKDNSWIAAYDLLNEPLLLISDRSVLDGFFDELVRGIRKIDKNHLLFVEGDRYTMDFSPFKAFKDKNTACTFHLYPLFFVRDIKAGKKSRKENIRDIMQRLVTMDDMRKRLKRPVWCGETGASLQMGGVPYQEALLGDFLEILEEEGISWSLWSYKDARAMGSLHPRKDSPWMKFAAKASKGWEFWSDQEFCKKETEKIVKRYGVDLPYLMKRKIFYRVLCNYQMILTENYKNVLSKIPFNEFVKLPESFRFEKCEKWGPVLDMVRRYTKGSGN